MLRIGNFKETEKVLREYIENGNYSQSFIIVGWDGIGKRALVEKVAKDQINDPPLGEYSFLNRDKIPEESYDIFRISTITRVIPSVVSVDIIYESDIRVLLKAGLSVNLMRFDVDEWLEWAESEKKYRTYIS